jgi:hypothetical protein
MRRRRSGVRERGGEPVTPGLSAIMRWYQPVTRTICTLWSTFRLLLVLFKPGTCFVRRHGRRDSFYHVVSTRRDGNIHNLVSACKKLEWPKMQKNETYFLSSRLLSMSGMRHDGINTSIRTAGSALSATTSTFTSAPPMDAGRAAAKVQAVTRGKKTRSEMHLNVSAGSVIQSARQPFPELPR